MRTEETGRARFVDITPSAALWIAALLVGGLWFLLMAESAWYALPAVALAAFVGFLGRQSRAHARRRTAALEVRQLHNQGA